ncbi:hypothetical protein BHE74_00049045 [Ensete ventricosum]|uniref:Uncharacterized protein n=1 Tax=Ensete ventricosum TaxID=4639 RepID=A0A426XG52_ENSVE|nr:hypothetical protein B296_00051295 [Ensete ventricosum]RWW45147.1 hypothetical protein BHE74_00049045 [Ensete ventricosum]RZS21780.1 hypothetical protein BHM03_00054467 [Ensete ventricosum]
MRHRLPPPLILSLSLAPFYIPSPGFDLAPAIALHLVPLRRSYDGSVDANTNQRDSWRNLTGWPTSDPHGQVEVLFFLLKCYRSIIKYCYFLHQHHTLNSIYRKC